MDEVVRGIDPFSRSPEAPRIREIADEYFDLVEPGQVADPFHLADEHAHRVPAAK
jgi:hypothetical protein